MTALGAYKLDTGTFPTTESGPAGAAREARKRASMGRTVSAEGHPHGSLGASRISTNIPGDHGDEPDIISLGADGQPGGEGNNADIVSWSNK